MPGAAWRAEVTGAGTVVPWDGATPLGWAVAADDRWHDPGAASTVRQARVAGTPVVETRVRVPGGDAVHRVYVTAAAGGLCVVEIENDSPLPFAVAFTRDDLLCRRALSPVPDEAAHEAPTGVLATVPVGHRAMVRVALSCQPPATRRWPAHVPTADQVARGWAAHAARAGRMVLPADAGEEVVHQRCEAVLAGPPPADEDPVGFVLSVTEAVRCGEPPGRWLDDVAVTAQAIMAAARHRCVAWDEARALLGCSIVAARAGDRRAATDAIALLRRRPPAPPPSRPGEGIRRVAWMEAQLAAPSAVGACLLPHGLPTEWLGVDIEAHSLPVSGEQSVSFAVRWHGERPAVLWQVDGPGPAELSSGVDTAWSTLARSGEALWNPPHG